MAWQQQGSCVMDDEVEMLFGTSDMNLGECGRVVHIKLYIIVLDSIYID
mgnify:CR=1 FL=1